MDVDVATLEKILGRRVVKAARRQRRREAANLERKALCDDLEKIASARGRKDVISVQKPRPNARKHERTSKTGGLIDGTKWGTETEADETTFTGKHFQGRSTQ